MVAAKAIMTIIFDRSEESLNIKMITCPTLFVLRKWMRPQIIWFVQENRAVTFRTVVEVTFLTAYICVLGYVQLRCNILETSYNSPVLWQPLSHVQNHKN